LSNKYGRFTKPTVDSFDLGEKSKCFLETTDCLLYVNCPVNYTKWYFDRY